jgi:UDP-N-acetylmuramoyl-tripeptide--D-alanyl-D-alanine ligase
LAQICKDSKVYVLLLNDIKWEPTYENVVIIPFYEEIEQNEAYLLRDRVHLSLEGNTRLREIFYKELIAAGKFDQVTVILVENTLYALQAASKAYAQKVAKNMIRVSITGSSGKTTTKEMLVSVCKKHFGEDAVAYTKGNFNSETGLPLSVFNIREEHEVGLFEMGMNRENEIGEIAAVLKPSYAIVTNIGTAHIGKLGSRENIAREKIDTISLVAAFFTGRPIPCTAGSIVFVSPETESIVSCAALG